MEKDTFLKTLQSYYLTPHENMEWMYWFPLCWLKPEVPVVAYNLDGIYRNNQIKQIETVLKKCAIKEVIVIQNQIDKPEPEEVDLQERLYERDKSGYNFPWYVESYYYDESKSWLIYVSHEKTIAFAGEEFARVAFETIDEKFLLNKNNNDGKSY